MQLLPCFLKQPIRYFHRRVLGDDRLEFQQLFQLVPAHGTLAEMGIEQVTCIVIQLADHRQVEPFSVLSVVHCNTPLIKDTLEPFSHPLRCSEEVLFHRPFRALHRFGNFSKFQPLIVLQGKNHFLLWRQELQRLPDVR